MKFSSDGVVEGLEKVLRAMTVDDPWMRQLYLDDDLQFALKTGDVEREVVTASGYSTRVR